MNLGGTPDPGSAMRHNARAVFIAELSYDQITGTAIGQVPEGTLTLQLQSMAIDAWALTRLCRRMGGPSSPSRRELTRIMSRVKDGKCDQSTLQALIVLICECLGANCSGKGCGGGGGTGWPRACLPGGIWLPLKFTYGVEVNNGYLGQHGPLPFQDPWWKVVLLIIALIAWLVGAIESIVADKTGWGNEGDHPRGIGTVGASNRTTTDACIIELNGSRPAIQKVADVITGEPNNQPIIGLDTMIPIDPQVAFPSLAPADVVGKRVYKSGSRTGLTHGVISSIGTFTQNRSEGSNPDPAHPDLTLPNQFSIGTDPAIPEELFDDHGDFGIHRLIP